MKSRSPSSQGTSDLGALLDLSGAHRRRLALVYLLYLVNSVLNLAPAFAIRYYLDTVVMGKDTRLFALTLPGMAAAPALARIAVSACFLALMAALLVCANGVGVVMWRLGGNAVEKIVFDIRIRIHDHMNKLSLGYFHSERVGAIMTRAVGDASNISMLLRQSFNLTYSLVQFLLVPFIIIAQSPIMFLAVLAPTPLLVYAFLSIHVKLRPLYREQRENDSLMSARIQEIISGIREIKAFNLEDHSHAQYREVNRRQYDLQSNIIRIFSFNHQLQYGAKDLAVVLTAVAGGFFVITGTGGVTVGIIASVMALSSYFYSPISQFLGFYDTVQRGLVSANRVFEFLETVPGVKDRRNAVVLHPEAARGAIAFRDVGFSYRPDTTVLHDLTFTIEAGKNAAIVGQSGSGKSTLVSLLLRFYEVDTGAILIGDRDVREFTQSSLRKQTGIVFQETFLFYGTVRDNLRYIDPAKDEEDMIAACKAAHIYDTIMRLPEEFDTMIGERGVKLSGGERQRLAIARILLKDPAIVVLDEATSAVDNVSERLIQESLERMLRGRTALIIAHRLSTIATCDTIIVLDQGRIAEMGCHAELLERRGLFYSLHRSGRFI